MFVNPENYRAQAFQNQMTYNVYRKGITNTQDIQRNHLLMSFLTTECLQPSPLDQLGSVSGSILNDRSSQAPSSLFTESEKSETKDYFGDDDSIQEEHKSMSEIMMETTPKKEQQVNNFKRIKSSSNSNSLRLSGSLQHKPKTQRVSFKPPYSGSSKHSSYDQGLLIQHKATVVSGHAEMESVEDY